MWVGGVGNLICCLSTMTCSSCVFQRSLSPQVVGWGILLQTISRNSDRESNMFSVKGNQLSCPDQCTIPLGSELWPLLLLACFIFNQDEHIVSGPISFSALSGLGGGQVSALVFGLVFVPQKLKSGVAAPGSQSSEPVFSVLRPAEWMQSSHCWQLLKMSACCVSLAIPPFLLLENLEVVMF